MYLAEWRQSVLIYGICISCLVLSTNASFEACRRNKQCGKGYCCAGPPTFGFCMRYRRLGELCTSTYLHTKNYQCGCEVGLTCAIVSRERGHTRFRCVEIPPQLPEFRENTKTNSTSAITKLLTAAELRHLLKVIQEKPQIKSKSSDQTKTKLDDVDRSKRR